MINNSSIALSIIRETTSRFIPSGSKIILFGSRARRDNCNDSDYDFLVITKETIDIKKKRIIMSMIRKELAKFKIPADILIQSEEEVSSKKEITGHIVRQALQEGIAI
jgi:predicted nucleotidyltransferase